MISFTVYGNPVAQGRPRAFIPKSQIGKRRFPIVTDPQNSREWKQSVKLQAIEHRPVKLIEEPIGLKLTFWILRPKTLPKKIFYHVKRPDIENLAKAVLDALEGIIYRNDSQVVNLICSKLYCDKLKVSPGVEISVYEMGSDF